MLSVRDNGLRDWHHVLINALLACVCRGGSSIEECRRASPRSTACCHSHAMQTCARCLVEHWGLQLVLVAQVLIYLSMPVGKTRYKCCCVGASFRTAYCVWQLVVVGAVGFASRMPAKRSTPFAICCAEQIMGASSRLPLPCLRHSSPNFACAVCAVVTCRGLGPRVVHVTLS